MNTATGLAAPETEHSEAILHWTVECPLTEALAEVEIGARAAPFAMFCTPRMEVKSCAFWPERKGCGHPCVKAL
jgi:hypothetical protein